ncbi:hypothetical protein [Priestia filamentosa]|uniref:hypothetical protein n=1 Tax=Priestia filamentosa TaxID=1402861 RepID=UPI000A165842|nr:hypothetical protein [Priestia filamentosa]MDT3762970.1 hypothetical protein [Priestia filamentosa]OXS69493.1 hypothetical protein B1B01_11025 [Priestia filamentosa]WRU97413.1 hypothetical protein RYX51_10190 [Priestia filamentosa]
METESKGKDKTSLRKEVEDEWWFWQPIINKAITFTEALQMSKTQLLKVNMALEIKAEREEAAMKKKK